MTEKGFRVLQLLLNLSRFYQRSYHFDQFRSSNRFSYTRPSIQFSSGESIASRMAQQTRSNSLILKVFRKGITFNLRIPGLTATELLKAPGSHVAAFVPEAKEEWRDNYEFKNKVSRRVRMSLEML